MPAKKHCPYCGETHDRHEDAYCGCGCGSEPMGCAQCMQEGGPTRRFNPDGSKYARSAMRWTEDELYFDVY